MIHVATAIGLLFSACASQAIAPKKPPPVASLAARFEPCFEPALLGHTSPPVRTVPQPATMGARPPARVEGAGRTVRGVVRAKSGGPLAGVTVVATGAALKGTQAELTNDAGQYEITGLPPGKYEVTFYYSEIVFERSVEVFATSTTRLDALIDTTDVKTVTIDLRCAHKTTDCKESLIVDKDYIRHVPLPEPSELQRGAGQCPHRDRCGADRPPCR